MTEPPVAVCEGRRPEDSSPLGSDSWDAMFSSLGYDEQELRETLRAERDVMGTQNPTRCDTATLHKPCSVNEGTCCNSKDEMENAPPQVSSAALKGFEEALQSLAPDRRQAYQEALEKNPRVVELESPPHRYLQGNDYNFWRSAEQMVDYWTKRKEVFGKERFWKPLTLWHAAKDPNASALTPELVEHIRKASLTIALHPDKFGRKVGVFDHENWNPFVDDPSGELHRKGVFYFFHVISESELAVSNGCIWIVAPSRTKPKHEDQTGAGVGKFAELFIKRRGQRGVLQLVQSGIFPFEIRALHVLVPPSSSLLARFWADSWVSVVNSWKFLSFRALVHDVEEGRAMEEDQVDSKAEPVAVRTLRQFGLGAEHLPKRFGGTADGESFFEHRMQVERKRYALSTCSEQSTSSEEIPSSDQGGKKNDTSEQQKMTAFRDWAEEHLNKQEESRLQSQAAAHRERQQDLQRLHEFLQARLECARYLEAQYLKDIQFIRQRLQDFVAPLFQSNNGGMSPAIVPTQSDIVDQIMQNLGFGGRLPSCGLWRFGVGSQTVSEGSLSCTTEEQALWTSVQRFLLLEQQSLLEKERRLLRTSSVPDKRRPSLPSDEQDETCLDRHLDFLEEKRNHLEKQRNALESQNKFLGSSLKYSRFLFQSLDSYKNQYMDVVTNGISHALSSGHLASDTGIRMHPDLAQLQEYARGLAELCFDLLSVYDEQQQSYCNPAVLVSLSIEKYHPTGNSATRTVSSHKTSRGCAPREEELTYEEKHMNPSEKLQFEQDCAFLRDLTISILSRKDDTASLVGAPESKGAAYCERSHGSLSNGTNKKRPASRSSCQQKLKRRRHRLERKKMLQRL